MRSIGELKLAAIRNIIF